MRLNVGSLPSAGRMTSALVVLSTLLHLLVMGRFELSGDEAHYALYAFHLDWSYFDHPPMVGWLLATVLPFSDSEFALRLWPIVLSLLSSWLLFRLSKTVYPNNSPWLPFVAVALLQSTIIFQLLSMAMLPDTPLIPLGLAAALLLHKAIIAEKASAWIGVGILFGLAGLSKYTAVMLVVSVVLLVAWGRWRLLLSPWPWIGVVIAALLIAPVLWWNYQNEWLSINYQLGHGMPEKAWSLDRFGTSLAGQFLAYGPLLVIAGGIAGVKGFTATSHRFTLIMALPTLLFMGWNSGYAVSLPHWTLLGWALLSPLAAHWLLQRWHLRKVRVLAWMGAGYSLLLILLIHSALFSPWLPFEEDKYPLADVYGWEQAAKRASELATSQGDADSDRAIFAGNWSFASHLAWYVRPHAVKVTDKRYTQNDIWFGSPQAGEEGILVVPTQFRSSPKASGEAHFESCEHLEQVAVRFDEKLATSYELYRCKGYLE